METGSHRTRDGLDLTTYHWSPPGPVTARMLIVHGLAEHSGRWDHVAAVFSSAGYDVHGFDLRGHGTSAGERVDVTSFDVYLADVAEMVAEVATGDLPLVLYGHSMGGLICTLYAESNHPQPDCYVLSAPAIGTFVPAPRRISAALLNRVAPTFRMALGLEESRLCRDPAVGEAYLADPLVSRKGTVRFGKAMFDAMARAADDIDAIGVPTLVIHGGDDTIVPVGASATLAALPSVERRVWPGLRHEVHNEPEQGEVLAFVVAWLDDVLKERAA